MKLLNTLPGFRRTPYGLECRILRRMPVVLLAGTVLPALLALAHRGWLADAPAAQAVKQIQLVDYLAIGFVVFHWTLVFTVSLLCIIVWLMKGPAYVADRYDLPDHPHPKD